MKIVDTTKQMMEKVALRIDEVLSDMPDGKYYNQQTECIETAECIAVTRNGRVIAFRNPSMAVFPINCYVHPEKVPGNTTIQKTGTPREVTIRRTKPMDDWDSAVLAYNLEHCSHPIVMYHVLGENGAAEAQNA